MNADDHNPPHFHVEYAGKHAIIDFMGRCTIINDTLAWDIGGKKDAWNSIDIDPISLWKLPETAELFQA